MAGKISIRVDSEKCQGHARCKALAPELFVLDDYGFAQPAGAHVPPELVDKAYIAQANCPEAAIDIDEAG